MDPRRGEVGFPGFRSELGRPERPPFFFLGGARRTGERVRCARILRTIAAAGLLAAVLPPESAVARDEALPAAASPNESPAATIVLATPRTGRLQTLDCTSGREIASFATARETVLPLIALAPDGTAAFVAAQRQLLRLSVPALELQQRAALAFDAKALAVSGGAGASVLAGGAGASPLSAHDAATLETTYAYRLDDARSATVSSMLDRPARSRFVVAFSDLAEVWEIAYDRDAEPVFKGLVHDYRMREAIELPGRYTSRTFEVPSATRALVAGALAHEVLRIDAKGALGVLNLHVRREIERPTVEAPPAPARIAAWRGTHSRGWVLADEGASTLRVLDARSWKLVEPLPLDGEVLAIAALDDGAVLAALAGRNAQAAAGTTSAPNAFSLVRVDVELRQSREVARSALRGARPYRFAAGTNGCFALVDADHRWIAAATALLR